MSLLAKVFVVIQTVVLLMFLGVQSTLYQHKRDWRNSYAKLKERYTVMSQRSGKEIDTLRQSLVANREFVKVKETEVRELKSQLAVATQAIADWKTKLLLEQKGHEEDRRNLESVSQSNSKLTDELGKANKRIEELTANLQEANTRRAIAEGQVARLIQLNSEVQKNLSDLRESYASTRKQLKEKELLIAMAEDAGVNFARLLPGPPVPAIDGKVAAVKDDMNPPLVLLSVGSDDKVEKGVHFSIYRGSEFVGKVVVEKVLKDSCGCRVLFTKEGQKIQAGDSAATRLQ